MQSTESPPKISPPTAPRQLTLSQIEEILSRPLPKSMLRSKQIKGQTLTYIPWYVCNRVLSKYAIGWDFRITKTEVTSQFVVLVGELTIPCSDGVVIRQSTGMEALENNNYGDAVTKAESQCFRRCCARFGLGLYLYDK
jgi:hypothetical protein